MKIFVDSSIYNVDESQKIIKIVGDVNIANLVRHLFQKYPTLTVLSRCMECSKIFVKNYGLVYANTDNLQTGFHAIKSAILNSLPPPRSCCGLALNESYTYGAHLLVDTDLSHMQGAAVELHSMRASF